MSEELIQRNLIDMPDKIGDWNFYSIGSTTLKALKEAGIIPNCDYGTLARRKPDALITSGNAVIAVIEYKKPSQLRTYKQIERAVRQELDTAKALGANVYIVTDRTKTFWINPSTGNNILMEDKTPIAVNFSEHNKDCVTLISRIIASVRPNNDILAAPSAVDPLPLAKKVWQDLWSVSGATPENCLYTFVEIFIFKYLSDLKILSGIHSFGELLKMYSSNTEDAVLEHYAQTVRKKIKEYFPGSIKDGTTIINGTIFVSKDDRAVAGYASVFRRILNRFDEFGSLENIDYDFKSRLFETFLKESISKKNWGQYFTPLKVVRAIVNMANFSTGMKICDPACGVGKFLLEPILRRLHQFYEIEGDKLKSRIQLFGFDKGFDKEEQKTIILAKANMLIYMSDMIREHHGMEQRFAELFNDTFSLQTNSILGTLAIPARNEYDLILTNPPYVMSGSSNLKEEIAKDAELRKYFTVNAMGIEGLFMEWIINALKPGGKAFVIVPDGIMNRSNDQKLRSFILEQCNIDAVISLPLNTFFTTNKKTYILVLTKKIPIRLNGIDTLMKQDTPVFTYLCSEIGETRDSYRFNIEQNDLEEASIKFNMFKGAKTTFGTDDRRCKIKCIDEFYDSPHWCIERWWPSEELIALGIEDEVKTITVGEFRSLLRDTASALSELENFLYELEKVGTGREQETKEFLLSDVFEIRRGSGRYTKSYVQAHKGKYPLFSGNTAGKFADIDSYDYEGHCLTWAIDGLAGYIMVHEEPFSATNHRGILIPKINSIDLQYAKYVLEPIFRKLKKGREGEGGNNEYTSLPPFMLEDVKFSLPVKTEECRLEHFALSSMFTVKRGFSKYTKTYAKEHPGTYPVYSASGNKPLAYIDTYDYDGYYLTWAANGFAGTMMIIDGKFSINGDRGILIPKSNVEDLNLTYIKCILEPVLRSMAKGRRGENGSDEFTKLSPSMLENVLIPMPVNDDATINIDAQREAAERYSAIEMCKEEVSAKLDIILRQRVMP